jgi:hypothetical protein
VIAGTIFGATKVPLCTWFRAMYHLTHSKGGISSIELGHRPGVTQTTAWKIKHNLMQVMMERDATKRLTGRIEIDDAYLGGERNGGKRGRGSPGKTPIVAAVETTPEGKPIQLKLRRVTGFRRAAIATLAKRNFDPASTVVSDGLRCFTGVSNAGCVHQPIITGSGRKAALNPRVQVGQYHPRQHQEQYHWHLPRRPRQPYTPLPRRIRTPVQPPIRSCRHDATARLRRDPNLADAIPSPQIG